MVSAGLLDATVQGLITGAVIAGGALGLSLIYDIAEVPNFAHGDMITIGAYLALVFNNPGEIPFLPDFGSAPFVLAAVIGVVLAGILGAVYELAIFRKFRNKDADLITMVIVSLGLALVLRNAVLFLVGSKNIQYQTQRVITTNFDFLVTQSGLTVITTQRQAGELVTTGEWGYPWWLVVVGILAAIAVGYALFALYREEEEEFTTVYLVPPKILGAAGSIATVLLLGVFARLGPQGTDYILGTQIGLNVKHITILTVVIVAMFILNVVLKTTKLGRAMRATSDNMDLAKVRGVDADRVQLVVWVVAAMLAALAGILTGWFATNLTPNMGFALLLPIFAAVILGGISSPYGAVAGAMIIGVSMDVGVYLIPGSSTYRVAIAFVILIAVLLVKPEGIWGDV